MECSGQTKIGVIGAGAVGSACLLSSIMRGIAREIVVVDRDRQRAKAVVTDLQYGVALSSVVQIRDGDYSDLTGAALVMIAAGMNEKTGGATNRNDPAGRLKLLESNVGIYRQILPGIFGTVPNAVILVVSDPPDPLADFVRTFGFTRVLSTGTFLDSLRFRFHVAQHLHVDPASVAADVLGEHGTSEVFIWSSAHVAGVRVLEALQQIDRGRDDLCRSIEQEVRYANITIIEGNQASQFGIGMVSARIAEIVLRDERGVIPIGSLNPTCGVTLSMPSVVGQTGVVQILEPPRSDEERQALQRSAEISGQVVLTSAGHPPHVATGGVLQTLSTHGKSGVAGNARGVKQYNGEFFAVVNNGSNTVAVYKRDGNGLTFDKVVTTTTAPVSVDFGNHHMYVAGATTVDSFVVHRNTVEWMDGTTWLELAGGGPPPNGSTAQVGSLDQQHLLVTLKTDPDPGTVDIVSLHDGAITGAVPVAVSAPAGTLTPFGFSVYHDGTALITLAHSNQDGLFRNGAFASVIDAGQSAPCWTTRVGKYVFTVNAGSKTIGRVIGTGSHVFVDNPVAATITTGGGPSDIDADAGVSGVIDHAAGQSHLSLFTYNAFSELTVSGAPINLGVANANGVAIMSPADQNEF